MVTNFRAVRPRVLGMLSEQLSLHQRVPDAVGLAAEPREPPVVYDAACHGRGHPVVSEGRAPPGELGVGREHDRLRLVGLGDTRKGSLAPSASSGRKPSSSMTRSSAPPGWASSRSSLPSSRARRRRITIEEAVKNLADPRRNPKYFRARTRKKSILKAESQA